MIFQPTNLIQGHRWPEPVLGAPGARWELTQTGCLPLQGTCAHTSTRTWLKHPLKADPETKFSEQVVHLRGDTRRSDEGVGKSSREGRETIPGNVSEVTALGNQDLRRDWLEQSLVPHRYGLLPALLASPEWSHGHRMTSAKRYRWSRVPSLCERPVRRSCWWLPVDGGVCAGHQRWHLWRDAVSKRPSVPRGMCPTQYTRISCGK